MKGGRRRIGILILTFVIVMQFIQPNKNISANPIADTDISHAYSIPQGLHLTLIKKCYDCHSNNTHYPWYFNVQPIGWWLAAHVHEGKQHLNFSAFANYPQEKAQDKLEEIWEVTEDESMPLRAYTMFHSGAKLNEEERKAIYEWLTSLNVNPD